MFTTSHRFPSPPRSGQNNNLITLTTSESSCKKSFGEANKIQSPRQSACLQQPPSPQNSQNGVFLRYKKLQQITQEKDLISMFVIPPQTKESSAQKRIISNKSAGRRRSYLYSNNRLTAIDPTILQKQIDALNNSNNILYQSIQIKTLPTSPQKIPQQSPYEIGSPINDEHQRETLNNIPCQLKFSHHEVNKTQQQQQQDANGELEQNSLSTNSQKISIQPQSPNFLTRKFSNGDPLQINESDKPNEDLFLNYKQIFKQRKASEGAEQILWQRVCHLSRQDEKSLAKVEQTRRAIKQILKQSKERNSTSHERGTKKFEEAENNTQISKLLQERKRSTTEGDYKISQKLLEEKRERAMQIKQNSKKIDEAMNKKVEEELKNKEINASFKRKDLQLKAKQKLNDLMIEKKTKALSMLQLFVNQYPQMQFIISFIDLLLFSKIEQEKKRGFKVENHLIQLEQKEKNLITKLEQTQAKQLSYLQQLQSIMTNGSKQE